MSDASPMERMRAMLNRKQVQLYKSVASAAAMKWSQGCRKPWGRGSEKMMSLEAASSSHLVKLSFSLQAGPIIRSPENGQAGVEMEAEIWSSLPAELVWRIVAFLPVPALLRLRCVCREWESGMRCSTFLEPAWFFLCSSFNCRENSCAYSPTLNRWYTIPLTFLPPSLRFPLTSVGGLLLVRGGHSKLGILCVCNPFTKSWRELPCMRRKRLNCLVGVLHDSISRSFKIVVAGGTISGDYECTTEVYDSTTDCWNVTGSLPRDYSVKVTTVWTSKTVFCANTLYCLTSARPYNIMAYAVEQGGWTELKVPLPEFLFSSFLLQRQDRLVLVGGVGTGRVCQELILWELQQDSHQWLQISRMPDHHFRKIFRDGTSADVKCAGNTDLVYFFKHSHSQVMVCDLSTAPPSWRCLPVCPLSFYFQRFSIRGLFVEPRLDAPEDGAAC